MGDAATEVTRAMKMTCRKFITRCWVLAVLSMILGGTRRRRLGGTFMQNAAAAAVPYNMVSNGK